MPLKALTSPHKPPFALRAWRTVMGYALGKYVRISTLHQWDKAEILNHLLSLGEHDRYLRFGYAASDEHIASYVRGLNFKDEQIYGIYKPKVGLVAVAHLAPMTHQVAPTHELSFLMAEKKAARAMEFGVSVLANARGQGLGGRLFERAMLHAQNCGVQELHIQALSENAQMLKIAQRRGAHMQRDGSETQAFLRLPKPSIESVLHELVVNQYGNVSYANAHSQLPLSAALHIAA